MGEKLRDRACAEALAAAVAAESAAAGDAEARADVVVDVGPVAVEAAGAGQQSRVIWIHRSPSWEELRADLEQDAFWSIQAGSPKPIIDSSLAEESRGEKGEPKEREAQWAS
jgi:hypothetical protein